MTRRWRNFNTSRPARCDGISQNIAYSGLREQILTFPKRRPYATNIIVATVKTAAADAVIQNAEGKEKFDWNRLGVFTAFGCFYLGAVQWFIYVTVFSKLCPNAIRFANAPWAEKLKDRAGQIDLMKQVALDNFIHYTFVYFPVFYTFKELIQGDKDTGISFGMVQNAMKKYWNNIVTDNLAIWALWVPGDILVYACPIWMRLPLNHSISFVWTMILSFMRGA